MTGHEVIVWSFVLHPKQLLVPSFLSLYEQDAMRWPNFLHLKHLGAGRALDVASGGMGDHVDMELRHGERGPIYRADRAELVEEMGEVGDVHRAEVSGF